ncbi:MAG: diguanylate cyclase [Nitrospirae bacterium]|nr:diguanylate cyclase [Nitrospirota bacterium]
MVKLGIIGGNIGASALLSLLKGEPSTELVGIYEKKLDSPGVILAKKWSISVYEDIKSLCDARPEIVINVTGDIKLSNEIRTVSENKIEVIEGVGARLLWEIIEKQKRAKIEVLKTIDDQKTIFSLISEIGETERNNNFFDYLLDKALEIADAPAGSIAMHEDDTMRFVASKGLSKRFTENKSWGAIQGGLTEIIIQNKEILTINDTLKVDYTRNNPALLNEKIRAVLACPIVLRDEVVGILYLDDFKPRQFSGRQKASLSILAVLTGIAFDKFELTKKIDDLRLETSHLMEISNDAVFITDPAGQILLSNERATEILGYSGQNLSNRSMKSFIKDDTWEFIQGEVYSSSILTGYKTVVIGSGDIEVNVNLNAIALKDTEGTISGLIFVLASLKEEQILKKAIEDKTRELEDLRGNLEKKVMERTEELEKINRELEYANQLKGRFIANMSHELRTPLNSIIGFSDVLLDRTFGDLTENQERYIKNIYTSGKHLLELINNVLDIAKIEAGKYEMVYETFSVDDVLSEIINIMNPLAENKFIEIVISIGEGVSTITADRVKLKQILYNLLSNAIKFTPEGGMIKVTVAKQDNLEGRYPWAVSGMEFISFSVHDTGVGISPEDKEMIFDEFGQVSSEFSRKYGGAGLGLALTKKLVELHGGNITVESKLGEGSTFTFLIPVTSPVETAAPEPVEAVSLNFPWMKEEAPLILVVEDDLSTAELLTLHLTQSGYKVAHAFDGHEAIEKAKTLQPFAITLDVLLPKKDGWEVLQELKSDPKTSDIPVIIHSIVDNKDLAFALGATDYLLKPLDKEALFSKLEELNIAKGKKVLPLSVLIIESEDEATKNFKDIFEPHGFLIYTAPSGKRGIELATALRPAVILLDFSLSDMLGFDVIKEIKDNPSTKDIPIFIITERDLSVDDRMSLVGNIERIVQKHAFDTKELIGHIKELELLYPRRAGLIDELTGIFSHRYFQIRLAQEVERATRYKLPLNLLILDLDYFDQYVKKHGEHYGNLTIKKVAELLKKNIRGSDVLVRYGGDSFAIILPNTVVSAALSMGNRFNAIIRNYPFIYEDSQPKGHLTGSIGLTFLDRQTTEELILCAKKALNRAFHKGGDRVEVYSSEQDEIEKVGNP